MHTGVHLSEDERKRIIELHQKYGLTNGIIAHRVGVTYETVRRALREARQTMSSKKQKPKSDQKPTYVRYYPSTRPVGSRDYRAVPGMANTVQAPTLDIAEKFISTVDAAIKKIAEEMNLPLFKRQTWNQSV